MTGRERTARSLAAEAGWHARLAELSATDGGEPWAGALAPRLCWCAAGHERRVRPANVQQGWGICSICAGNDPVAARAAWLGRLVVLGATDGGEPWAGVGVPRLCWCVSGHECHPRPTAVQQGGGICPVCAGNDSALAETAWHVRMADLDATDGGEPWAGVDAPVCVGAPRGTSVTRDHTACWPVQASAGRAQVGIPG